MRPVSADVGRSASIVTNPLPVGCAGSLYSPPRRESTTLGKLVRRGSREPKRARSANTHMDLPRPNDFESFMVQLERLLQQVRALRSHVAEAGVCNPSARVLEESLRTSEAALEVALGEILDLGPRGNSGSKA